MILWTDDFNRADGNLAGIWFEPTPGVCLAVENNALTARDEDSAPRLAMVDSDLGSYITDQYAQAVFGTVGGTGGPSPVISGLSLRNQPFVAYFGSGYGLAFQHDGTNWVGWFMTRYFPSGPNYGFTSLASGSEHPVGGDVVRLEAEGTTLRWKLNGTVIDEVTDTNIPQGCPGVYGGHVTTSGLMFMTWDDFEAGDFSAETTPPGETTVSLPGPKVRPRSYGPFRLRHEFHPRRKAIAAALQNRQEIADAGLVPVRYGYHEQEKPTRTRRDAIYRALEKRRP